MKAMRSDTQQASFKAAARAREDCQKSSRQSPDLSGAVGTDPVCRFAVHVRSLAPNPDDVHWYRVARPLEPARSLEHTCDRCRNVSYEYLGRGGRRLIRRKYRSARGELVIHETPGLLVPAADELWRKILNGVAR